MSILDYLAITVSVVIIGMVIGILMIPRKPKRQYKPPQFEDKKPRHSDRRGQSRSREHRGQENAVECYECGAYCSNMRNLKRHKQKVHGNGRKKDTRRQKHGKKSKKSVVECPEGCGNGTYEQVKAHYAQEHGGELPDLAPQNQN